MQSAPKERQGVIDLESGNTLRKPPTRQTKRPRWVQFASPYLSPCQLRLRDDSPRTRVESSTPHATLPSKIAHHTDFVEEGGVSVAGRLTQPRLPAFDHPKLASSLSGLHPR